MRAWNDILEGLYIEELYINSRTLLWESNFKCDSWHTSIFRKIHQASNNAASDYHNLWWANMISSYWYHSGSSKVNSAPHSVKTSRNLLRRNWAATGSDNLKSAARSNVGRCRVRCTVDHCSIEFLTGACTSCRLDGNSPRKRDRRGYHKV